MKRKSFEEIKGEILHAFTSTFGSSWKAGPVWESFINVMAMQQVALQDLVFTASYDVETHLVEPGLHTPQHEMCMAKTCDPKDIAITFNGTQVTGFADGGFVSVDRTPPPLSPDMSKGRQLMVAANGSDAGQSWEECSVDELVPGDVITHVRVSKTKNWVTVKYDLRGTPSPGWEVTEITDNDACGFVLNPNGQRDKIQPIPLLAMGTGITCRVRPWDRSEDKPEAAKGSLWNGTCPRCGRGTYTGAFKVEHEGDCV